MIRVGGFQIDENLDRCDLPDEVQTAWDEIYNKVGYSRIPVMYCGKQVVNGTNYMVICKAAPVVLHQELCTKLEKVIIHAPLPNSTTDGYYEVSRETLIDSALVADQDGVAIANPYVEYKYVFEAEYAAGINIYVTSKFHTDAIEHIYVISGKVAELDYKNGLCLRQAKGVADISGRYGEYPDVKQFTAGNYSVAAKGENGKYKVILWHNDKRSFSLYAPDSMTEEEIKDFIDSLCVIN